jgi:hypothetical protein
MELQGFRFQQVDLPPVHQADVQGFVDVFEVDLLFHIFFIDLWNMSCVSLL